MPLTINSSLQISPDLERLLKNSEKIAPEAIKRGMGYIALEGPKKVKQRIVELGLVKSGKLSKSITVDNLEFLQKIIIGSAHPIAHIMEGGAKPHEIRWGLHKGRKRPKTFRKALMWSGAEHPVKVVKHPGVRAYRFLEGTIENMERSSELESLFARGVREAIERTRR